MRGRLRLRRLALFALVVFSVCGLAAACTGTAHKGIEAIGVVASVGGSRSGGDLIDTYTFDDGRSYSMHFHGDRSLDGPGMLPEVGDLLIAGSKPDFWILVAHPSSVFGGLPPGCFELGGWAGWDLKTTVELDFGVTLQKAPTFDPLGHIALAHFGEQSLICLDRQGRVMQIQG